MQVSRLYYFIHVLSIDVAVGAVIGALFFANLFQVTLYTQGLVVLGLTVWAIYTADHLLDAWRLAGAATSQRHRFYQEHFGGLLSALAGAVVTIVILLPSIRTPLIVNGIYFSMAVLVYLVVSHKLLYLKELAAGVLYSGGVCLPALSLSSGPIDLARGLVVIQFLLVVWMNLLLFAWMDYDTDRADRQPSLVTLIGRPAAKALVVALLLVLLTSNLMVTGQYAGQRSVLAAMGLLLIALVWPQRNARSDLTYRMLGDAVFFLPALLMI